MQLLPRLNGIEARTLGAQFRDDEAVPPYPTWVSDEVLTVYRRACLGRPDLWLGVWVWPDGMASMIPVPPEGERLQDVLAEMYEGIRTETERQVLMQFPPAGEA